MVVHRRDKIHARLVEMPPAVPVRLTPQQSALCPGVIAQMKRPRSAQFHRFL